jgi:outer membrane protein OmpA-like peptidoglycan-associated protein
MPSFDYFDKLLAEEEAPKEPCHDTVIIRHDSIIVREIIRETIKQAPRKEIFNVYYDNDKAVLRQDGLVTVSQVAERMEEDKELYAVVIGYCDNTGSNGHNFGLGDRRANSVVDELMQEYNIPADHLYGKGSGKLVGRRSKKSYGPNRRSAIHLVDEETFELMKMQLDDKSDSRDESIEPTFENSKPVKVPDFNQIEEEAAQSDSLKTVPLSESARKEKINEYKERVHDTVVVEKGMTLSKLARKYYNNTQCWVYIYVANRDKLATPNDMEEGMELMIPELTEDELKISVKDCLRLYSIAAHNKQ